MMCPQGNLAKLASGERVLVDFVRFIFKGFRSCDF